MNQYIGLSILAFGCALITWNIIFGIVVIIIGLIILYISRKSHNVKKQEFGKQENRNKITESSIEELQQKSKDENNQVSSIDQSSSIKYIQILENKALNSLNEKERISALIELVKYAENKDTPKEILNRLAKNEDKDVRRGVASNPNTSYEIIQNLATDNNDLVRASAISNLNSTDEIKKNSIQNSVNQKHKSTSSNIISKSQEALISRFESLKKEEENTSIYKIESVSTLYPEDGALMQSIRTNNNLDIQVILQPETNSSSDWLIMLSMYSEHIHTQPVAATYETLVKYLDGYIICTEACIQAYIKLHHNLPPLRCSSNDTWIANNYLQIFQYLKRNRKIWDVECIDITNDIGYLKYKFNYYL